MGFTPCPRFLLVMLAYFLIFSALYTLLINNFETHFLHLFQIASPACTELEVVMLDWVGKMLNLPKEFLACSGGKGGGVIQVIMITRIVERVSGRRFSIFPPSAILERRYEYMILSKKDRKRITFFN